MTYDRIGNFENANGNYSDGLSDSFPHPSIDNSGAFDMKISKSFRNSQRKIIEAAVKNSRLDLNLPDLRDIKVKSNKSKSLDGWADVSNGYAVISINRRLKGAELFCCVAHEMVHVSQLLSGRLVTAAPNLFIWNGKVTRLTEEKMAKMNPAKYRALPWEREAYYYGDSFLGD